VSRLFTHHGRTVGSRPNPPYNELVTLSEHIVQLEVQIRKTLKMAGQPPPGTVATRPVLPRSVSKLKFLGKTGRAFIQILSINGRYKLLNRLFVTLYGGTYWATFSTLLMNRQMIAQVTSGWKRR
jgi:hypothetical protein